MVGSARIEMENMSVDNENLLDELIKELLILTGHLKSQLNERNAMNWSKTTHHCLEQPDGSEIEIEVRWRTETDHEDYEIGDTIVKRAIPVETIVEVRREDNDDLYEMSERPAEPWHYLFDKAEINGDIQPN